MYPFEFNYAEILVLYILSAFNCKPNITKKKKSQDIRGKSWELNPNMRKKKNLLKFRVFKPTSPKLYPVHWRQHTFWLTTSIPGISIRIPVGLVLPPEIIFCTTATTVVSVILASAVWEKFQVQTKSLTIKDSLDGLSVTCKQNPVGHLWCPCLCSLSYGTGNQGHESGHLVEAPGSPSHHGCPEAHVRHAHKQVSETEVGALCCPRRCCKGPWEKCYPLVQVKSWSCLWNIRKQECLSLADEDRSMGW